MIILLITSYTFSSESGSFLTKVRNKLNAIKPFSVEFTNRVISDSVVEIEEKGIMIFRNSETIKWEYTDPEHKIWILTGDSYEYYNEEDEQITRGRLDEKARLWIFQLLYKKNLGDNIRIDKENREISFLKKEEGTDFKIMFDSDLLPLKVIQKDPTGVDIVYLFRNYKTNLSLSSDRFKLNIDGNVDIIELE